MKLYYLFCNGSRGDCEPAISLAQYIIQNGNRVCIFSNIKNKKLLDKSGISYRITMNNSITKQPEEVSTFDYYNEFKNTITSHIDIIDSIVEKPYCVISMGDVLGKFVAEKFQVKHFQLVLQYYNVPSSASNKSYLEYFLETLERWYRQLTSRYEINYFNQIRSKYGLEPINDFCDYVNNNEIPYGKTIVANSMILSNFNYIKHDQVFISGNINLIKPIDPSISQIEGLEKFLNNDTYFIYLNLGSMSQNVNDDLFNLYQEAFREINCKVIIGCNKKVQPDNNKFFYCNSINQHELFPKMDLIIQCGGLGTVFKACYYGKPQLIVPKNFEEPFWAKKFVELGSGDYIDFKKMNSKILHKKVINLLHNDSFKCNAQIVSKSIDMNGVNNIYKYINKL